MLAVLIYYKLFHYLTLSHIIENVSKAIISCFLQQGVIETDFNVRANQDKECGCKEPDDISTTMRLP